MKSPDNLKEESEWDFKFLQMQHTENDATLSLIKHFTVSFYLSDRILAINQLYPTWKTKYTKSNEMD